MPRMGDFVALQQGGGVTGGLGVQSGRCNTIRSTFLRHNVRLDSALPRRVYIQMMRPRRDPVEYGKL